MWRGGLFGLVWIEAGRELGGVREEAGRSVFIC